MKLKSSRNPRAAAWRRKRLAAPWLEERRLVAVPSAALGAAGVWNLPERWLDCDACARPPATRKWCARPVTLRNLALI